ncbi:unnamed protein product [Gongylonema pulchrum]|uniref:Kininogen-1 n=1 Tax=Gongylonema pulchrum TaxID=637853 RepID=A0A183DFU6_9BILA|nr:unnamed protein product [Gongylonema pulchrum]
MMVDLAFVLVLLLNAVIIDGKVDKHVDKHDGHVHEFTEPAAAHEHKAYHDHEDVFGAKMYKTLFKVKHREQLSAIKHMMKMDEQKREKLVLELILSIVKVHINIMVFSSFHRKLSFM